MNANCGNCRFAGMAKGPDGKITFVQKVCRRYPPQLMLLPTQTGSMNIQTLWPIMDTAGWCG